MRILFRIIPLCMLLLGFVACDDEDEAKVETLGSESRQSERYLAISGMERRVPCRRYLLLYNFCPQR